MRNERQRNCLVVPQRKGTITKSCIHGRMRPFDHSSAITRQGIGELVVPVQPRDFFNYINLALNVQPPAGNVNPELNVPLALRNKRESQALQQSKNLPCIESASENAMHFRYV